WDGTAPFRRGLCSDRCHHRCLLVRSRCRGVYRFFAAALPPLRPAALCCAVVPPWRRSPPEPDFSPPCFEASGELAILAARSLDMPLSFRASYCFLFLTWADFVGMSAPIRGTVVPDIPRRQASHTYRGTGIAPNREDFALTSRAQPPQVSRLASTGGGDDRTSTS